MAILRTARLILRPFREDDVDLFTALTSNPDFMRFSLGLYDREKTVAFVQKIMRWQERGIPSQFVMVHRTDQRVLGYCGFFHHPEEGIEEVEIGYRLDPSYWNRGLTTEAVRAVRDHGFGDLKLPRVISIIHGENIPSQRVAEKNGLIREKKITFRGAPALVFAMTQEAWLAQQSG